MSTTSGFVDRLPRRRVRAARGPWLDFRGECQTEARPGPAAPRVQFGIATARRRTIFGSPFARPMETTAVNAQRNSRAYQQKAKSRYRFRKSCIDNDERGVTLGRGGGSGYWCAVGRGPGDSWRGSSHSMIRRGGSEYMEIEGLEGGLRRHLGSRLIDRVRHVRGESKGGGWGGRHRLGRRDVTSRRARGRLAASVLDLVEQSEAWDRWIGPEVRVDMRVFARHADHAYSFRIAEFG